MRGSRSAPSALWSVCGSGIESKIVFGERETSRDCSAVRRIKSGIEIMNSLNIATEYSRNTALAVPVKRTTYRRERRNHRNRSPQRTHHDPPSTQQVRLEFHHPQAREVNIAGSFNGWRPGATWMVPLGNGRWVKELLLPPGRYEYCFVVDGHWMPAPRAVEATKALSNGNHSVLIVPQPNGNSQTRHFLLQPRQKKASALQCLNSVNREHGARQSILQRRPGLRGLIHQREQRADWEQRRRQNHGR
jgi:Glycogen recognition site of AMP-activated protein kinase